MANYDIFIKNSFIIDGTGSSGYTSDLGISGNKIAYIGKGGDGSGSKTVIDGNGLVLSPGFIDTHGHSDLELFKNPSISNKLEQGVTTEVAGLCGLGFAPVSGTYFPLLKKYLGYDKIQTDGNAFLEAWPRYTTFKEYLRSVEGLPLGANMAFYAGQGTLRIAVMGFDNRSATDAELSKMKELLGEAMENGAAGLSTGLIYAPGVFTLSDEIIELCKVVKAYGGSYATHMRSESTSVVEAVKEAIKIGRKTGTRVIISHHKIIGKENWGKSQETLRLIDEANGEGLDISLDQYPYSAGATFLAITIPPSYHEGGTEKLIERLKDPETRKKIKEDMENPKARWDNMTAFCGFDGILIIAEGGTKANGKTIAQYAKEKGIEPFDALFDLLIDTRCTVMAAFFFLDEPEIEYIMKHPYTMIGTDGGTGVGHPRAFGTYPRVLGRYVRGKKVLTLEEAIRKMTSLSAAKIGLRGKGLIKVGYDADIVLFNPETIIDKADFKNPNLKNEGIHWVIVNGKIAVKNSEYTGTTAGRVVKL